MHLFQHMILMMKNLILEEFPCHAVAIRLVVLSRLSSCSVERAFSRLQLINERYGDDLFEDMLEIRLFMRCNGDLQALYENTLKLGNGD